VLMLFLRKPWQLVPVDIPDRAVILHQKPWRTAELSPSWSRIKRTGSKA
jgi:hypothetical protein